MRSHRLRFITAIAAVIIVSTTALTSANAATASVSLAHLKGYVFAINGQGFPANTAVAIRFSTTTATTPFTAKTLTNGHFSKSIQLPNNYAGRVKVTATAGTASAVFSATIAKPAQPATATAPPVASMPVSPSGHLGQYNLSSPSYEMANRFILPKDTTIDRWYFAMNGEGATCVGGRTGYGSGNGGINYGRIVDVNPTTGFPTGPDLAFEKVNACDAYNRSKSEFGLGDQHQAFFSQFSKPVALKGGHLYAFVLSNTDPNPGDGGSKGGGNAMSPNMNFANVADMGPNGKNTLAANTPGARYGLDPRETTMWSDTGGKTWKFGAQVGWYDDDNGLGKSWVGGYRIAGGANVPHGWTYMNWPDDSKATVTFTATSAITLTKAGGASSGSVGVVTVKNLSTGATSKTASLGTGVVSGPLSPALKIAAGNKYSVTATGSVGVGSSTWWVDIFKLGSNYSSSDCSSCSKPADRPMLFAQ